MSKESTEKTWLGKYPISHEDHIPGLETRAAIAEWTGHLPRHEAEQEAHKQYLKEQVEDSCAHHYVGCQSAHAAGDTDSAKKHGLMYLLALKALGHNDTIKPPEEVANKAKHTPSKVYKYKSHISDSFVLTPKKDDAPIKNDGSKND